MRKIFIFIAIAGATHLFAQSDSTATGEVVDAEIIIEKDKKIILPQADKISTPVEVKNFSLDPLQLNFQVVEPDFNFPAYKSEISFVETRQSYPKAKFQNYVKAGYGNFQSPLLEVGVFQQLETMRIGASVFHESFGLGPIGDENSGSSYTSINLSGQYKGESIEVVPRISYARTGYSFYGNTNRLNTGFTEIAPEAAFGNFDFGVKLKGGKGDLDYYLDPSISTVNQKLKDGTDVNKETTLGLSGGLNFKLNKKLRSGFEIESYSGNYTGGVEYSRSVFNLKPSVTHKSKDLEVEAGFTFSSSKVDELSESGIYPFLDGSWNFMPKWSLYAGLDGGMRWNSLNGLLEENRFLDDSLQILNTNLKSSIKGGIKGKPSNGITLTSGMVLDNYENQVFFVPSEDDSSRFILTYDGGTFTKFTFQANAEIAASANTIFGLNLEFYGYTLDSLEKAWHLPDYLITAYFSTNIQNKLLLRANITAQGGIDSPISGTESSIELDPFIDLNLSATYRVTERLSVFFQVDNLLGNEYERFLGYPVRGASFKLGASYRF